MKYETKEKISLAVTYIYVAFCCIILLIPFLVTFYRSLVTPDGSFGLNNYLNIPWNFRETLVTSGKISLAVVAITTLITLPAAYSLTRYPFRFRRFIMLLLNAIWYMPGISYALALILSFYLIYKPLLSIWGFILAYSCGFLPTVLSSTILAFSNLDPVYEEAAMCLGAGKLQTIFRVILPLIGPGLSAGALLTFVLSFNEFITAFLLFGPTKIKTAPVKVFDDIKHAGMHGFIAAEASLMQLISLAVCLVYLKIASKYMKGTVIFA